MDRIASDKRRFPNAASMHLSFGGLRGTKWPYVDFVESNFLTAELGREVGRGIGAVVVGEGMSMVVLAHLGHVFFAARKFFVQTEGGASLIGVMNVEKNITGEPAGFCLSVRNAADHSRLPGQTDCSALNIAPRRFMCAPANSPSEIASSAGKHSPQKTEGIFAAHLSAATNMADLNSGLVFLFAYTAEPPLSQRNQKGASFVDGTATSNTSANMEENGSLGPRFRTIVRRRPVHSSAGPQSRAKSGIGFMPATISSANFAGGRRSNLSVCRITGLQLSTTSFPSIAAARTRIRTFKRLASNAIH